MDFSTLSHLSIVCVSEVSTEIWETCDTYNSPANLGHSDSSNFNKSCNLFPSFRSGANRSSRHNERRHPPSILATSAAKVPKLSVLYASGELVGPEDRGMETLSGKMMINWIIYQS